MTWFRISKTDRLHIGGQTYRVREQIEDDVILERDDAPGVHVTLSSLDIAAQLDSGVATNERGYFRRESAYLRTLHPARSLKHVPERHQEKALWRKRWCDAFLNAERKGLTRRSDEQIEAFIRSARYDLSAAEVAARERKQNAKPASREPRKHRKKQCGTHAIDIRPPCARTLRQWLKVYSHAGKQALALAPRTSRCGGGGVRRLHPRVLELLNESAETYMTREQCKPGEIYVEVLTRKLEEENRQRSEAGQELLPLPSLQSLRRTIKALPAYHVALGRNGRDAAFLEYRKVGAGFPRDLLPLQHVEIDAWEIHLHALVEGTELWKVLSDEQRNEIKHLRLYACMAIDVATRTILGFKVNRTANTALATATLKMCLIDKTAIARAAGAQSDWPMHGLPELVCTDQGSEFQGEFKEAAALAGIGFETPPAKLPWMRAHIERLFKTIDKQFVSRLPGHTGSGVQDAKKRDPIPPALTVDELIELLIIYVVDRYHHSHHQGIGTTPYARWSLLTKTFGTTSPMDGHELRTIFGLRDQRKLSRGGLTWEGARYNSDALHDLFLQRGAIDVWFRYDPDDIGHISVEVEGGFLHIPAPPGLSGHTLHLLREASGLLEVEGSQDDQVKLAQVMDTIQAAGRSAAARVGVTMYAKTPEERAYSQSRLRIGGAAPVTEAAPDVDPLLGGTRAPSPDAQTSDASSPDEPPHRDFWFSQ